MKVTIQKIAEAAGVSRGTVDRALNNRGRIDPQVSERILRIADEMGYVPRSRRQTASRGKPIKIGVVTQLAGSSFMLEVNRGIQKAASELREKNIELILKEGMTVDEKEQLCFVGMDNRKSGRTAAGLLGMLTRGKGKILIITGYFSNHVDNQRVDGFLEEVKKEYPELEIAGVHGSFDETAEVEKIIENVMTNIEGITGILVVSGGQAGVGKAFEKLKLDKRPYVVIYDQTPKNEKALKDNTVDFLIDQNGYVQGHKPPLILADLLLNGKTQKKEFLFTDIIIKTKYNL